MQYINVSQPNDGLGDKNRDAWVYTNANFSSLNEGFNLQQATFSLAINNLVNQSNTNTTDISSLQAQVADLTEQTTLVQAEVEDTLATVQTIQEILAGLSYSVPNLDQVTTVGNSTSNQIRITSVDYESNFDSSGFIMQSNEGHYDAAITTNALYFSGTGSKYDPVNNVWVSQSNKYKVTEVDRFGITLTETVTEYPNDIPNIISTKKNIISATGATHNNTFVLPNEDESELTIATREWVTANSGGSGGETPSLQQTIDVDPVVYSQIEFRQDYDEDYIAETDIYHYGINMRREFVVEGEEGRASSSYSAGVILSKIESDVDNTSFESLIHASSIQYIYRNSDSQYYTNQMRLSPFKLEFWNEAAIKILEMGTHSTSNTFFFPDSANEFQTLATEEFVLANAGGSGSAGTLQDVLNSGATATGQSITLKQWVNSDSEIKINVDDFFEPYIKLENSGAGSSGHYTKIGSSTIEFDGSGDHSTILNGAGGIGNIVTLPSESGILATREFLATTGTDVWKVYGTTSNVNATQSTGAIVRGSSVYATGSSAYFGTNMGDGANTGTLFGHIYSNPGITGFIQMFSGTSNGNMINNIIGGYASASTTNPQMTFVAVKNTSYAKWGDANRLLFSFRDGYGASTTLSVPKFEIGTDYLKLNSYTASRNDLSSASASNFLYTDVNGLLKSAPYSLQTISDSGNTITNSSGGSTYTNTITGLQVRIRKSDGTTTTTLNQEGLRLQTSSGSDARYLINKIQTSNGEYLLPTAEAGTIATIGTTAPASANDTGTVGEIKVTSTHIYTCIAPDTWVRAALASW